MVVNHIDDESQPQVIEHFIGQEKVKNIVKKTLEACWSDGSQFPDTLSLGSPGLGKTQISHLIAKEIGSECKEALASSFKKDSDLNGFLMEVKDGDVLFLDEIHTLKKDLITVLYRAMENRKIFVKSPSRNTPFTIILPRFTFIAGTTDYHVLPKPFLDRFKLTLYFEFYSENEIEQIVRNRSQKLGWECENAIYAKIAQISKGIPRVGLRILENTRLVSRAEGLDLITLANFYECCSLNGLDTMLGLGPEEQKYLKILFDNRTQVRLNTIAMKLGTKTANVSQTIEPFLFRAGLATKDEKGRMITEEGYDFVENLYGKVAL